MTTLFQIDLQHAVQAAITAYGLRGIEDFFMVLTKPTGLMAFVFIGVGVTMVGHMWRLVFRSGGVMDVTSEHIAREPQDRAQRKMQRELDEGI